MIFIKRKEIVLDCFTTRSDVHTYFEIQPASKLMPDWWKKIPSNYTTNGLDENPTLKCCAGFIDYYSEAISIPLWTDISFKSTQSNKLVQWMSSDKTTEVQFHHMFQLGDYLSDSRSKYIHMKIVSHWLFSCKKDIKFLFSGNTWSLDNPQDIVIPTGISDFKYQCFTNINMLLFFNNVQTFKLNAGSSLIHLFPITDEKIKIKTHLIGEEEYSKISYLHGTNFFSKNYFRRKNKIKKLKKCPISTILNI